MRVKHTNNEDSRNLRVSNFNKQTYRKCVYCAET